MEEFKQKQRIVYRPAEPEYAGRLVKQGRKFIPVGEDFPEDNIPEEYTLARVRYDGETFSALVPKQTFFYMANPGEGGDAHGALDEIADLYGEIEDFEKELMGRSGTSLQEADWAMMSRDSYATYLVNILTNDGSGFDPAALDDIGLNDPYVEKRAKTVAAMALGKTVDDVKQNRDIADLLIHRTPVVRFEEGLEAYQKGHKIRCWAGSHWEVKWEYRTHYRKALVRKPADEFRIEGSIGKVEQEMHARLRERGKFGRHTPALLRQYVNLAYIARENPNAQLDIVPPKRTGDEKDDNS